MALFNSILSPISQTRWNGEVEFVYREIFQTTPDMYHYGYTPGVQNVKIFIGKNITGGHIPDGTARAVSTDAQDSITVTQDSVLKFSYNIPYDMLSEFDSNGNLLSISAENNGTRLAEWHQSVILAGLVGSVSDRSASGAQVTAITGITATDGSDAGLGIKNMIASLRKRKAGVREGSLNMFVFPDVYYQARLYQPIASSFFVREEGAVNRDLPQEYKAFGCWVHQESNTFLQNFASTSYLTSQLVSLDAKYAISMANIYAVAWDKSAFAVGSTEEVHSFAKDDVHIDSWALSSRVKFGTAAVLSTGIQLMYKNF